MRAVAITLAAASLAACAVAPARDGGVATLDALADAQAICAKKGMTLKLKPQGDAQYIGAYACQRN